MLVEVAPVEDQFTTAVVRALKQLQIMNGFDVRVQLTFGAEAHLAGRARRETWVRQWLLAFVVGNAIARHKGKLLGAMFTIPQRTRADLDYVCVVALPLNSHELAMSGVTHTSRHVDEELLFGM